MKTKTLHFRPVNISRNKATPDNAVKACAYRSGQNLYDEKEKRTHFYGNRHGVIETAVFAPDNSPRWMQDENQKRVWERFGNEIERAEDGHNRRASAMLGKDFQVAAPRELSQEQNWVLAERFATKLNEKGLAVAVAFHEEAASDGGRNPHFHFFVPMREVDRQGFGKRYRNLDAKGKGTENPELMELRREYFRYVNEALEDAGVTGIYYDPEKQEGIEPGIHKGKQATALERKGEKTRVAAHNRHIGYENIMRPYDRAQEASGDPWAFQPPASEKDDWHKKFAEWQLIRGSTMAARDATQKNQSSVTTPAPNRSLRNTETVREQAKLSVRLNRTWQEKERHRSHDIDRGR